MKKKRKHENKKLKEMRS